MSERLTIADSKRAFHKAFPFVIPPIYRRVTDELLVELHLLSHQKSFKVNPIFAVGLSEVFDSFTRGYRPNKHLEELFDALCKSNGFDPASIRSQSKKVHATFQNKSLIDIENWLTRKKEGSQENSGKEFDELLNCGDHYTRLITIGHASIINGIQDEKQSHDKTKEIVKEISSLLGYSSNRVDRDISQYSHNLEKVSQALELIKESIKRERKKREES